MTPCRTMTENEESAMQMNPEPRRTPDESHEPLCCFGPGGDYHVEFSAHDRKPPSGSLIQALLGMTGAFLGLYRHAMTTSSRITPPAVEEPIHDRWQHRSYYISDDSAHTSAAPDSGGHLRFPVQARLFTDDGGTVAPTRHKPQHRIRAPKRVKIKATRHDLPGQGTLFEVDRSRTRTA